VDGYVESSPWVFRLIKEEYTLSLTSVLRSNVLRLLTMPHDPKIFIATQSSSNNTGPSSSVNVTTKSQMSQSIIQLSSLVIDLAAPRFTTHFNYLFDKLESTIDTDIQLFLPALNPVQLHFIQQLKSKVNVTRCESSRNVDQGSVNIATQQLYECSPPPLHMGCHPLTLLREFKLLNAGQQDVVKKVIASLDYTLLLGMPGTGKTSTLSFVIRTLVARGQRVLVTSYTNAAVDNLMIKLRESGVSPGVMGRLGHVGSLDSKMEDYAVDTRTGFSSTVKDLSNRVEGYRILGATVLTAARSGLLQKLAPFDWCVMDEAGQISQPAALGGMLLASKYLLVGDNYQLPPLVVSLEAQQAGMEVSMFKRLSEAHPNAVISLTTQYRMNEDIMAVSNALVYENRLQCGSEAVAQARLCFENSSRLNELCGDTYTSWVYHCLLPEHSVVFVNTDSIRNSAEAATILLYDGRETEYQKCTSLLSEGGRGGSPTAVTAKGDQDGNGDAAKKRVLHNPTEIAIISLLIEEFARCGLRDIHASVGIVSPYRSQVRSIQKAVQNISCQGIGLDQASLDSLAKNGVSTVDKYQGRDMEVIVLSLVRSNERGLVGDLLRDWRRVNVALTRAKRKLLIVGSLEIMERVPVLNELKKIVMDKDLVFDFPPGVLERTEQIVEV